MSRQGFKSLFPMEDIAVMGIWELLPHLYKIRVSSEPQSSLHKPVYMWFFLLKYLSCSVKESICARMHII
jgi:hypothetical protein